MISTSIEAKTVIDFSKMANSTNGYDSRLVHPMRHVIEFVSKDGSRVSLAVGQLATLAAIVEKYPNTGAAIDKLFSGIESEFVSDICRKF